MLASLSTESYNHRPLTIRAPCSTSDIMNSRRIGYGSDFGLDASGSEHGRAPTTAEEGGTYRRRSMTIQDMLNPSDEEIKRSPKSQWNQSSSEEDRQPSRYHSRSPICKKGFKSSQTTIHTRRGSASHAPKGGSRRPSHRLNRSPSSSPDLASKETRAFRHPYTTEEVHFIWYLRIDRGYLWPDLLDAFNAHFCHNGRVKRVLGGLQCRYYRLLGQNNIPQVRMLRTADMVQRYGMIATLARNGCHPTYSWLGGQYQNHAYGEMLDSKIPFSLPRRFANSSQIARHHESPTFAKRAGERMRDTGRVFLEFGID